MDEFPMVVRPSQQGRRGSQSSHQCGSEGRDAGILQASSFLPFL